MNNVPSILQKIRIWGLTGILDYLKRNVSEWMMRRVFFLNARRYPLSPTSGITILADMTHRSSLSKVMRDLAFKLKDAGIPFQTYDLNPKSDIPDEDVMDILTPRDQFRILKYDHVIEMFSCPLPNGLPIKRSRVVFWEFTTGLLEFSPNIGNVDTVIAMSDFNHDVFTQLLPKTVNVKKIIYPFFFEGKNIPDKLNIRTKYKIPADAFVVFFNFDYGSSFNRKNPDGSIRAFAKAFAKVDNAYLVFKTKGAARHKEERDKLARLSDELGVTQRVIMIDDYLPQDDIYGLTGACDVYLSLHRGEGFGLGIAEAMSLGKAVIATNYSSTTEFCLPTTSIPIPYTIAKVPKDMCDNPCYHAVKEWAEPDINAATAALRRLYEDPALRTAIGTSAKKFLEEYFSLKNFKASIESFLADS